MKSFILLFCTLCLLIKMISSVAIDEHTRVPTSQPLSVDLGSCSCLPTNEHCEVSISKSLLLISTSCPEKYHYCCKGKAQPRPEDDKNFTQGESTTTMEKTKPPPKIPNLTLASPPKKEEISLVVKTPRPQRDCSCRARDECEEKYTDYSFGFHCTHAEVHCCPPKSATAKTHEQDLKSMDKYLISVHDVSAEPCQCVPEGECRKNNNEIGKRKDTLCPYNLIECCGTEITKKSDVVLGDIDSQGLVEGRGMGAPTSGQKGFTQPIQLPELKIPEENAQKPQLLETSTMIAPPDLPSHYHHQEEIGTGHFNGYRPVPKPIQRTPYYGSQPPYWQRRPTSFYPGTERASPSFSDSVWNFLFTG